MIGGWRVKFSGKVAQVEKLGGDNEDESGGFCDCLRDEDGWAHFGTISSRR
jgi:hypothetical protein